MQGSEKMFENFLCGTHEIFDDDIYHLSSLNRKSEQASYEKI